MRLACSNFKYYTMITGDEFVEELENLTKKSEILAKTYFNNPMWIQVDIKLKYILTEIKKDKRTYGY